MKNWLTQGLGLCALVALSLTACKKDEVQATLTPTTLPTLKASTNAVVLAPGGGAQTAVTYTWTPVTGFSWTGVDHPYNPAITYYIQVDKQGNNFNAPASIPAGAGPTTNVTVADLNTALTTLGITPGTATPVEVRLNASAATNTAFASPAVVLTATGYKVCTPPAGAPTWALIGTAGVNWDTDVPLVYNCDTKTYDLTRTLNVGAFKFRANGKWDANLGGKSSTGGELTQDGSDLSITKAGTYTISLSPGPLDEKGKATLSSYTIK